jgi:hypothetical protein
MGMYWPSMPHASIITDILWSAAGQPVKAMVAEANYGVGWVNPNGEVPWSRVVEAREVSPSGAMVVDYEN